MIDLESGQIKFPGTQQPSADANTLDDYEEGTFTSGITYGGAAVGVTFNSQSGAYTKIGNQVHIRTRIHIANKGSSTGSALLTGLPFTVANVAGGAFGIYTADTPFADQIQAFPTTNGTTVELKEITNAGASTNMDHTNVLGNSVVQVGGVYEV